MKKLLVMIMVLGLATVANAALKISVNGVVDAEGIVLAPSDTVLVDVWSDGQEAANAPAFLYIAGPGSLNIAGATNSMWPPGFSNSIDLWTDFPMPGDQVWMDVSLPAVGAMIPAGTIIDNIILHCEDFGEVTLSLYMDRTPVGGIFQLMDTQTIIQPEPITIALLGLGGLFLRRRK